MSDTTGIDPDITPETPDEKAPNTSHGTLSPDEAPDVDVASPDEVDPSDGTDDDDAPVDNPAG